MNRPDQVVKFLYKLLMITIDIHRTKDILDLNHALVKIGSPKDYALLVEEMNSNLNGNSAIRNRIRIGQVDIEEFAQRPSATLAGAYGRFMKTRGLRPEEFPALAGKTDFDYVLTHFYETHDLWHVVTGFDTDPAGEAGLQAFYSVQIRSHLPYFVMAAILMNAAIFSYEDRHRRVAAIAEGFRTGKSAKSLMGIDWREYFDKPLTEVRRELDLESHAFRAELDKAIMPTDFRSYGLC
jgi:ubiquinone biosynthesis protein COQ4